MQRLLQLEEEQLADVHYHFGAGRRRPLLAAGIYEAPPPDKPDIGVDTDDLLILNGRNGFAEAILAPLLEVVRARRLVVNA